MGLFGNRSSRKGAETKTVDELKKDRRLLPFVEFITAVQNGDRAEIMAAAARKMECWKCGHEATVGEFLGDAREYLEKMTGEKVTRHGIMAKCPRSGCTADPIFAMAAGDD